jgi:hypothetical protein
MCIVLKEIVFLQLLAATLSQHVGNKEICGVSETVQHSCFGENLKSWQHKRPKCA